MENRNVEKVTCEQFASALSRDCKTRKLRVDLVGRIFSRLTVLFLTGRDSGGNAVWACSCQCSGKVVKIRGSNLLDGKTQSCGCMRGSNSQSQAGRRGKRIGVELGMEQTAAILITRVHMKGNLGGGKRYEGGFAIATGEPIESTLHTRYLAIEPTARALTTGTIDILTKRMMTRLAECGVIPPQGDTPFMAWMTNNSVLSESWLSTSPDHVTEIYAELRKTNDIKVMKAKR